MQIPQNDEFNLTQSRYHAKVNPIPQGKIHCATCETFGSIAVK